MTISLDFVAVVLAVLLGNLLAGVARWVWDKIVRLYRYVAAFVKRTHQQAVADCEEARIAGLRSQLSECEKRREARACAR